MKTSIKSFFRLLVSLLLIISLVSCSDVFDPSGEPIPPEDEEEEIVAENITNPDGATVGLFWADGTKGVENATWNDASTNFLFTSDMWEPGMCKVFHIKVELGDATIAVNYRLDLVSKDNDPWYGAGFDVYYIDPAAAVSTNNIDGKYRIGTLSTALGNTDDLESKRLMPGESAVVTIAVRMRDDVSNAYRGVTVDCSVQLTVSRILPEEDSFDNNYDG